jgi:hypothetical protein
VKEKSERQKNTRGKKRKDGWTDGWIGRYTETNTQIKKLGET